MLRLGDQDPTMKIYGNSIYVYERYGPFYVWARFEICMRLENICR